jgi:transcriptional regulator with XRE-family HTH domain
MEGTMTASTLGGRIEQARTDLGFSTRQLATRIGVRTSTVENWEGDRSEPRSNKLTMLAGVLNVPVLWLLSGQAPTGQAVGPFSETSAIGRKLERALSIQQELSTLLYELSADVARLQKDLDADSDLAA